MNYVQMWLFMTHKSEPLRQTSLLMLLAGGIGHGETLLHGLRAHETESSGEWASKVGQLRLLMEQGHSLAASLAMVRDLLPDPTVSAIRTAESTGTLADVLIDEARRISQSVQSNNVGGVNLESLLLLAAAVGTVMISLVSFLMIFIIPKFKEIFIGFGVELPPYTIQLINVSDWVLSYGILLLLPGTGLVIFGFWWIYSSSTRKLTHGYHRLMENWPRYWLPGLLRQLSLSAATDQPLGAALDSMMMDMPPGQASRKISELRYRVAAGEDTVNAMRSVGLLKLKEVMFLRSSLKTKHLDWGLRHLADALDHRRRRWMRRIPTLLAPTIIIAVGLMVLFVCVAMFMPLIKLLNDLA